ncbi:MAG: hypothetical protein AMXMBFR53_22030 [Gemmatimonadota bacterium]
MKRRPSPLAGAWLALAAAACVGDTAHQGPVARVGAWTLEQERFADLLVLAQPLPLDTATVGALVDHWIVLAALAQRAAGGEDLAGAEAMEASLWLERREAVLEADRQARGGGAATVRPDEARAEFDADSLRLLAHVLRRAGPLTSAAERDLQRRTAQGILQRVLEGGSWAEAVAESEDAETRRASGLLGLVRVGDLPPRIQGAAAALLPGQVSVVVESPAGFHVLHRPRFDEVGELFADLLRQRRAEAAEGRDAVAFRDSVGVSVAPGGPATIRALALDPDVPPEAATLAHWNGGALQAEVAARYVAALPPEDRVRVAAGDDEAARRFLEQLATREARIAAAQARGIQGDPATLEELATLHRTEVAAWRLALSGGGQGPSEAGLGRYMERLVSRQEALDPVPPLLRRWLLEGMAWAHDAEAREGAVARARHLLGAAGEGPG